MQNAKRLLTGGILIVALTCPVLAQDPPPLDPTARAKAAGAAAALGVGDTVFTTQEMEDTVLPFDNDAPPETAITGTTIESETNLERVSGSEEADVFQSTLDSMSLRPAVTIEPDDPGLIVSDTVHQNADDIVGHLFSAEESENPACDFTEFEVLPEFERFCDRYNGMTQHECTIDRVVEVDRRDTWQCDIHQGLTNELCDTPSTGTCTTSATCTQDNVSFGAHAASWTGNTATLLVFDEHRSRCSPSSLTVPINLSSGLQPTSVVIGRIGSRITGAMRYYINDIWVGSYMTRRVGDSLWQQRRDVPPDREEWVLDGYFGSCSQKALVAKDEFFNLDVDVTDAVGLATAGTTTDDQTATLRIDYVFFRSDNQRLTVDLEFAGPCCSSTAVTVGAQVCG